MKVPKAFKFNPPQDAAIEKEIFINTNIVECPGKCGEKYCCEECQKNACIYSFLLSLFLLLSLLYFLFTLSLFSPPLFTLLPSRFPLFRFLSLFPPSSDRRLRFFPIL